MKKFAAVLLVLSAVGLTESIYERELIQIAGQRDQALAAVAEPVNRRYKENLEALLRRATQANDLDAALKIRQAIANLSGPAGNATVAATTIPA